MALRGVVLPRIHNFDFGKESLALNLITLYAERRFVTIFFVYCSCDQICDSYFVNIKLLEEQILVVTLAVKPPRVGNDQGPVHMHVCGYF
jgi:hypothetical protein